MEQAALHSNPAKFQPPRPAAILHRERLLNMLLESEAKKLLFIHAQAGQGKSTLAADHVRSLRTPAVWYTLDREDEDVEVFKSQLIEAVRRACGSRPHPLPSSAADASARLAGQTGLASWADRLTAAISRPLLIVLDDYHVIPATSELHEAMQALIMRAPHMVRFMIISRSRPALPAAKSRADRSWGEITGDDLRFTDAEVQDLFGIVFRMHLSPTEAALIASVTEGWPAGLILMHDHLASLAPATRAHALTDRRATGFRTHVFDYLAQEVLSNLPRDLQRFLVRTPVSDHLPPPLLSLLSGLPQAAARGKPSVASMVAALRDRNLFITVSDQDGSVRFHALFREFLLKKLMAQEPPACIAKLYATASSYFLRNGDIVRGIDIEMTAGRYLPAVRLIESACEDLIARGQTRTLVRWIDALPLELRGRPWLLFSRAMSCRFTEPRSALTFFEHAYHGFREEAAGARTRSGMILSLCGIIEECFHSGGDFRKMAGAARLAERLLGRSGRESPAMRARLQLGLGMAWFFIGELEQGATALGNALQSFRKQKNVLFQISCTLYLVPCALYRGDIRLARTTVRAGFDALSGIPEDAGSCAALLLVSAMTDLFEGDFDAAQENIDRCRDLSGLHALGSIASLSLNIGGWVRIARGDYAGAESLLRVCRDRGIAEGNAFFSASASHLLALCHLFQGDLDEAEKESSAALAVRNQSGSRLFHAIYLLADGAIRMKRGDLAAAERTSRKSLSMLQRIGAAQQEAIAHLLLSRIFEARQRHAQADEHLRTAFRIGRDRGFLYYSLFTSAETAERAAAAVTRGLCGRYCSDLAERLASEQRVPAVRIFCLGGFRILVNGSAMPAARWKSPKEKLLIKMLAVQDTHRLSRDLLAETFWPRASTDRLRPMLNSVLHRVRKALAAPGADPCVLLQDDQVVLNSAVAWTDTHAFRVHLTAADAATAGGRPDQALQAYERAFALYQGDLLPDDHGNDAVAAARDRLRSRYLEALARASRIAETADSPRLALGFQERLFRADPCDEKACQWLMLRYQSEGMRTEAIRVYERCELALSRELDAVPEARTKRIFRSIISA